MSKPDNRTEFLGEKNLYVAEPLIKATQSWHEFSDVPDEGKSTMLYFEALERKELYVAFLRKDDVSYAKLYIVGRNTVDKLYVRSWAVNPVRTYRHVTKKK